MAVDAEELMTVREAARQCGRTAETVRRWIWAGKLPAQKLDNQLFVRRADLASAPSQLESRRVAHYSSVLDEIDAVRERIRQRIGGTIDVLEALDESRESHPAWPPPSVWTPVRPYRSCFRMKRHAR